MELKLIFQLIRRWAWLLTIGVLVGGGIGYVINIYQTPEYEARAKILVMEPVRNSSTSTSSTLKANKEMADTYLELLFTQPILDATSQKVGATLRPGQIRADRVGETGLLQVIIRDTDPERAALMANTLVQVLIEQNEALQTSRFSSSEESLQAQVAEIEQELSNLETQIEQRSEQSIGVQTQEIAQQKLELEQQINGLLGEITVLEQDIDDLTPKAIAGQLAAPLTLEQRNLMNEKRTLLAQKQFQLDLAQDAYTELLNLPTGEDAVVASTNLRDIEQANLELYRQLYSTLLSNYEAVRLARLENTPNVVQVERAVASTISIQAGPLRYVIMGAVLGLLATGLLAFTLEYMDDTLKTPQDVANVLGLPVVGYVVNEAAMEKSEGMPYVTSSPRSPMAETFRTLRTNLEFASVDKPLKTILITSPGSGDGKTTVATNLAAVMAQANKRVILLEGDLRRPRVHRALGMSNQVGLSDVFRGQMDIRDVARYSKVKDLAAITSGSLPPNPTELLGSARMAQILARLVESASVVIIDSPPFVVSDATVLSAKVDGVLLVIQPGRTHAEAARAMLTQLNRAGAHVVGVVLNRVPRKNANYYGYYRYENDTVYSIENTPAEQPAAAGDTRRAGKGLATMFSGKPGKIGEEVVS
jgi:capsular exopolysaccharide synthesis family protein